MTVPGLCLETSQPGFLRSTSASKTFAQDCSVANRPIIVVRKHLDASDRSSDNGKPPFKLQEPRNFVDGLRATPLQDPRMPILAPRFLITVADLRAQYVAPQVKEVIGDDPPEVYKLAMKIGVAPIQQYETRPSYVGLMTQ